MTAPKQGGNAPLQARPGHHERNDDMANPNGMNIRNKHKEPPEVDEAERKIGGLLEELEDSTDTEVKDVDLEEVVDTDANGGPVVKKSVDIQVENRPVKKGWTR
ncbi:hypothetical protein [Pseudorhodoferax aquiterrae]|nr:hypothetical protein [Pseudorhodoferax aquiterrae]